MDPRTSGQLKPPPTNRSMQIPTGCPNIRQNMHPQAYMNSGLHSNLVNNAITETTVQPLSGSNLPAHHPNHILDNAGRPGHYRESRSTSHDAMSRQSVDGPEGGQGGPARLFDELPIESNVFSNRSNQNRFRLGLRSFLKRFHIISNGSGSVSDCFRATPFFVCKFQISICQGWGPPSRPALALAS